ncbi:MAG: T9SS type A sorting domain-containing protein [Flavobacteriales bacterium]|nr:T9SS type A sorting domain-containing protein [Flavobacteriales bacterium]
MKTIFSAFIILLWIATPLLSQTQWTASENERSDTIDILAYKIELDLSDNSNSIKGICEITFQPKIKGVDRLNLDLLELQIDAVTDTAGTTLPYQYNDSVLSIEIDTNMGTKKVKVEYHGVPFHEGWGGWHNQSGYTFNLGVGFKSIPHNLGKTWHPCFDNFVERAKYTVAIKTSGGRIGVGSGILQKTDTLGGDTTVNHWMLSQTIPTYLYGISITNYKELKSSVQGLNGMVPISLFARASDTNAMKALTRNLDTIFHIFENRFGPYLWDKIGYQVTPIGAMEHATNISIPLGIPESTVAHELAHHWWGNLVTCETDRDMWINEGMAVFCAYVYHEDLYGRANYLQESRSDHYDVVKNAHLVDGDYFPLSGVPRVHTYSSYHVYKRGGLIANNLRTYLGDQDFFNGMKAVLDSFKFNSANSYDIKRVLEKSTGKDLTSFFDRWIFEPGFPDFVVEDVLLEPRSGLNKLSFTLRQLMGGSNALYSEVPLEVTLMDEYWNTEVQNIVMNGSTKSFELMSPYAPTKVFLNSDRKLNYAMTFDEDILTSPRVVSTQYTDFTVRCTQLADSAFVRTEAHWAGAYINPKNAAVLKARIQHNRHWRVDGLAKGSDKFTGQIIFNAKKASYDYGLVKSAEDSVVLLYRKNSAAEWEIHSNYELIVALPGDSIGIIKINDLQFGEFALAERDTSIKLLPDAVPKEERITLSKVFVYPNPTSNMLNFDFTGSQTFDEVVLLNYRGMEVRNEPITKALLLQMDVKEIKDGVYFYLLKNQNEIKAYGRFVKVSQ